MGSVATTSVGLAHGGGALRGGDGDGDSLEAADEYFEWLFELWDTACYDPVGMDALGELVVVLTAGGGGPWEGGRGGKRKGATHASCSSRFPSRLVHTPSTRVSSLLL